MANYKALSPASLVVTDSPRSNLRWPDPKVLRLTEKGEEIGLQTNVEMNNDDSIWAMQRELGVFRARLTDLEEANANLAKQNRALLTIIERLLDEQ